MTRRMQHFSGRQIAGAYIKSALQMLWMWVKWLSPGERFVFAVLIALPILYVALAIGG